MTEPGGGTRTGTRGGYAGLVTRAGWRCSDGPVRGQRDRGAHRRRDRPAGEAARRRTSRSMPGRRWPGAVPIWLGLYFVVFWTCDRADARGSDDVDPRIQHEERCGSGSARRCCGSSACCSRRCRSVRASCRSSSTDRRRGFQRLGWPRPWLPVGLRDDLGVPCARAGRVPAPEAEAPVVPVAGQHFSVGKLADLLGLLGRSESDRHQVQRVNPRVGDVEPAALRGSCRAAAAASGARSGPRRPPCRPAPLRRRTRCRPGMWLSSPIAAPISAPTLAPSSPAAPRPISAPTIAPNSIASSVFRSLIWTLSRAAVLVLAERPAGRSRRTGVVTSRSRASSARISPRKSGF